MATLKSHHYYVRKKQYEKCSLGIKEIIPHKDTEVSDLFAAQYDDMTKEGGNNEGIVDSTTMGTCDS